ncbi:hypothetical protein BDZ89DRAFT_1121179 [Hymenopellis radicata]|nr:hypothetical protein BDZ89DRAFT_1121179 [Hymenopellis radicata]
MATYSFRHTMPVNLNTLWTGQHCSSRSLGHYESLLFCFSQPLSRATPTMPRYTLENFSLSDDFSEQPMILQALLDDKAFQLDLFEFHCGLTRGESEELIFQPQNTVCARRNLFEEIQKYSIVLSPPAAQIRAFGKMTAHNTTCNITVRQNYHEIFPLDKSYDYVVIPLTFNGAIYVQHPDTKVVTRFDKPYTNLPSVTLTLNPCFPLTQIQRFTLTKEALSLPHSIISALVDIEWNESIPIPFFFVGSLPEDFPNRRIPWHYEWLLRYKRLHFPPSPATDSSSPLGKRSCSEDTDSELNSEWDFEYRGPFSYPPTVDLWVDKTDAETHARWVDDCLDDYVAEPVRSFKDALAQPAAWVEVWNRHRRKQ